MSTLTLNAWTAAGSSNSFQDVQASDVGQYGNTGPDTVFTSSCGATLVEGYGTHGSILHCGAGHLDYYGNEVYAWDIANRTWSRLSEPSTANGGGWGTAKTNGLLTDGTPHMPHTYYWLLARNSKLILGSRQTDDQPAYAPQVSTFDPSAGTWSTSTATPTGFSVSDQFPMVIDTTRDVMWVIDPDPLSWASYDFDLDSWTAYTSNASAYATGNCAVYVPTKDCVVLFAEAPGTQVVGLDPSSPSDPGNNETILTTSGTQPTLTGGSMAHWSANLGKIVYYQSRGNALYTLTPPAGDWSSGTWTWAEISLTGTTGVHDGSAGTYSKFQVVEFDEGSTFATVIGDVDGDYRVVKLAEAA